MNNNLLADLSAYEKAAIAARLTDTVSKCVFVQNNEQTKSQQLSSAIPIIYSAFCDLLSKIDSGEISALPNR